MLSFNSVLLLLFISLALCSGFQFTSNITAKEIEHNGWKYKEVKMSQFSIAMFWLGANFRSADIKGDLSSGSADVVTGSCYVAIQGFPFSFLAYYKESYDLNIGLGSDFATVNVSASAGYVGVAYLRIVENDPNGTVVATHPLRWVTNIATDVGFSYSTTETSTGNNTNSLQYVTYTATSNVENDNFVVKFSFLVSSVSGIVDDVIKIVPKSMESIVSISGYSYQSSNNTLSLVLGVGTGAASVTASGKTLYSQGNSVYFSLNENATVGGVTRKVTISSFSNGNLQDEAENSDFSDQLTAKYKSSAQFKLVKVTFPPGADNIVYDPSVGTGTPVQEASSASPAPLPVAPCFALVMFLVAVLAL